MEKSIIIEEEYPYSPEEVWEAITDQSQISEWLMDGNFEPRIGAEFEFRWSNNGYSGSTKGKVLELDRPLKLSYTWGWGTSGTVVTYYLEPTASGTKLRLEHTGFVPEKDENVYQGALAGWQEKLAKISSVIAKQKSMV